MFSCKQLTGTRTRTLDNLTVWLVSNKAICHVILTWTLCQAKLFLIVIQRQDPKEKSRRVCGSQLL